MRSLISPICLSLCLSLCLQACGGNTAIAISFGWGSCDFEREDWAQADRFRRGCMMASFLDKHPPQGMPVVELKLWLGAPDTYADFEDPGYLVAQADVSGRLLKEQLLVFRIDRRSGRVVEVLLLPSS